MSNMQNKFGKISIVILSVISFLVLLYFVLTTTTFTKKTANEIFQCSLSSIVEFKSSNESGETSYGTAIFIDDNFNLISNAHLVVYTKGGKTYEYEKYEIRFAHEADYREVQLIKYDVDNDLSFLKYDYKGTLASKIKISESNNIKTGDLVYAVGNGMNHGISMSQGIISIPSVNIEYRENIRNVIQCDLSINDGNSGGALLDANGYLIGITAFRLKDPTGNVISGVAYCIPIQTVNDFRTRIY